MTGRAALYRVLHRFLPCFYGYLFLLFANSVLTTFSRGLTALIIFSNINRDFNNLVSDSWTDPTWRIFGITTAMYLLVGMIEVILLGVCVSPVLLTGLIEQAFSLEMISRLLSPSPSQVGWLVYVILQFISIYRESHRCQCPHRDTHKLSDVTGNCLQKDRPHIG